MKVICVDSDAYPLKLGAEFEGRLITWVYDVGEKQELIWEICVNYYSTRYFNRKYFKSIAEIRDENIDKILEE
jgi:hypothetical protein